MRVFLSLVRATVGRLTADPTQLLSSHAAESAPLHSTRLL